MAEISKQALKVDNNQSFPNNNNGAITPSILRAFNTNMIDSMVDEIGYTADSSSWNSSISQLNVFTASAAGLNTGSLLVTASAVSNVITFTKGNGTTFNVTVADTTDLGPLNTFTASAQVSLNNLNLWTSSYQPIIVNLQASQSIDATKFATIGTQSGSWDNTSLNSYTASNDTKWNTLGTLSGSFVTESETGSFARTDVSNTFTQQNNFTSISASSFISASEFIGNGSKITGITASISLPILDEGIPQGNAFSMNFTGSAISAIIVGGTAVVSVNAISTASLNALTQSFNDYTSSTDAKFVAVGASTSSLNSFTQSQDTKNSTLATYTASVNSQLTSLTNATASYAISSSVAAVDAAQQSQINSLINATGSYATSAITASSLVTASVNLNTITFTKGDASTFNITVNTGSGAGGTDITSLNSFTASQETKDTTLASVTSSLSSATASLFTSTSLSLTTASFDNGTRNLTFTKGDAQTFSVNIPDVSGSTGNFATTGSNTFNGTQIINGEVTASSLQINGITDLNGVLDVSNDATFRGDVLIQSSGEQKFKMRSTSGGGVSQGFDLLIQTSSFIIRDETHDIDFLEFDYISSSGDHILKLEANRFELNSGSLGVSGSFTASLQQGFTYVGDASGRTTLVATSSFGGGGSTDITSLNAFTASQFVSNSFFATTGSNNFKGVQSIGNVAGTGTGEVYLLGRSGSLVLSNSTQSPTYAALGWMTSSQQNANTNLVFETVATNGSTIVSGSNNIFTAPAAASAGRIYYMENNNIFLNDSGFLPTISSSAFVAGAALPRLRSNMWLGTGPWTINTNSGVTSFSQNTFANNLFLGSSGTTLNLINTTGNIAFSHNLAVQGGAIINAASASGATVATGASGSNSLTMANNFMLGGFIQYNGPISSSLHTINGNSVQGGLNFNLQSGSRQYTVNQNIVNGTLTLNDNIVFSPTLGAANTFTGNNINGTTTINNRASASLSISANNINSWNINNDFDASSVASAFARSLTISGNALFGALQNNLYASGAVGAVSQSKAFSNNLFAGQFLSASIVANGTEGNMYGTIGAGNDLHIAGTSRRDASSANGAGATIGSAFFGRYNKTGQGFNTTAEVILAVGTGTSGSTGVVRKTGFLIDSGSNTFVEGTLNVSGATSLNGNLVITGSLTASLQQGYVWVGDASGITTTVATSSFGGGGGAAFPYTGDAVITGSLQVTGSFRGYVNALSVASSTASIDMVNGNFFTLNLPTSSTTHIAITNIKAGQTINLQVSQSSANTGSIAFAPNIKFAGGFDYTATPITGALDLVSFVAFDSNQILATSVKNLL
jgi:hypothetical protein